MYGSSDINGMGGIRVENNTPHQQSKTMPEIRSTVKIRGYFKQKALALGKFNRVVLPKRLPPELKHGELVEIAVMGMLGRVSSFYDTFYGEPLNVTFNYLDDVYNKTDFFLNDVRIDITSRFTHDSRPPITVSARPEVKLVVLHYDLPGIVNLMTILDNVGILRPLPNQLIKDINYIWELYLTYNVMRKEEISYNHGMNEDLDDLLLYVADFPNLLNYSDYRQIAYMYVEDPNEQEHYQYTDAYDAPVSEEVPEPEPEPGPTEEELELQRKRADQINRLSNHLTQKGVNETNLFGKFKLDPYKSFAIDSEETFFSLLKEIFPKLEHRLSLYTFNKLSKGGEFKLSYNAICDIVTNAFPTLEKLNSDITVDWVNTNIYEGVLNDHYKSSLYQFVKFINPDVIKWDILNLPMEEYKEADRKSMVDIVIEQLGLNSAVIKLIQPTSLNTDHVSSLLCTYHGEVELFEIIKKRLIEMKR